MRVGLSAVSGRQRGRRLVTRHDDTAARASERASGRLNAQLLQKTVSIVCAEAQADSTFFFARRL